MIEFDKVQTPAERHSRWCLVRDQLIRELNKLSLDEGRDFVIEGENIPHHYNLLSLTRQECISTDVLTACDQAIIGAGHWGVLVSAPDEDSGEFRPFVEISGGGFTLVRGGSMMKGIIDGAYRRKGFKV